jgi:SulP family sulfate permease
VTRPLDPRRLAGSLNDPGSLLPIALGLILFNGVNPTGMFFAIGIFYLVAGSCYRVSVPVEPLMVVGAYAIARSLPTDQVMASGLILGLVLLAIGLTGHAEKIRGWVAPSVIQGVEAAAGLLLMAQGLRLIAGKTTLQRLCQAAEPHLNLQHLGPIPIGMLIALAGVLALWLLRKNRRLPAGLIVIAAGIGIGLALGTHDGLDKLTPGLHLPRWLPYGLPAAVDFVTALCVLVLPQIPVTLDEAERTARCFGSEPRRPTPRILCIGMGLANLLSFAAGGMPLGHGAGPRAGGCPETRKVGLNVAFGAVFIALALLFGFHLISLIHLLPLALLGVLLLWIGTRMILVIAGVQALRDFWVAAIVVGFTLAWNLAVGLLAGVLSAWLLGRASARS